MPVNQANANTPWGGQSRKSARYAQVILQHAQSRNPTNRLRQGMEGDLSRAALQPAAGALRGADHLWQPRGNTRLAHAGTGTGVGVSTGVVQWRCSGLNVMTRTMDTNSEPAQM